MAKLLETLKSIACRPGPVKLPTWQLPKPEVGCETEFELNQTYPGVLGIVESFLGVSTGEPLQLARGKAEVVPDLSVASAVIGKPSWNCMMELTCQPPATRSAG